MKDDNPLAGATYLLRGLYLLVQPGIRRYVAVPLLINTGLFALGIYIAVTTIAGFLDGLLPDWLAWLEWLLWPLLGLVFLVMVFFTFSVLANIVAAPFNGFLAVLNSIHMPFMLLKPVLYRDPHDFIIFGQ